jgi:hypothetical protein
MEFNINDTSMPQETDQVITSSSLLRLKLPSHPLTRSTMKSAVFMTFLFTLFAMSTYVTSAPINPRDVFVPPVLYPHDGVVWKAGETHHVTWYVYHQLYPRHPSLIVLTPVTRDVSHPPTQITNKLGRIILAKGGILIGLGKSTVPHMATWYSPIIADDPLATGFDILLGKYEVTIPKNTKAGDDYTIVGGFSFPASHLINN